MALRVREYWTVAAGCDPTGQAAQERRIQKKKGNFWDGLALMKMENRTKHVKCEDLVVWRIHVFLDVSECGKVQISYAFEWMPRAQ